MRAHKRALLNAYATALAAYRAGRLDDAVVALAPCLDGEVEDKPATRLRELAIAQRAAAEDGAAWDGVTVLQSK